MGSGARGTFDVKIAYNLCSRLRKHKVLPRRGSYSFRDRQRCLTVSSQSATNINSLKTARPIFIPHEDADEEDYSKITNVFWKQTQNQNGRIRCSCIGWGREDGSLLLGELGGRLEGGGGLGLQRHGEQMFFMNFSQQVRKYLNSLFPEMHADSRNRRLLSHTGEVWIRFTLLR